MISSGPGAQSNAQIKQKVAVQTEGCDSIPGSRGDGIYKAVASQGHLGRPASHLPAQVAAGPAALGQTPARAESPAVLGRGCPLAGRGSGTTSAPHPGLNKKGLLEKLGEKKKKPPPKKKDEEKDKGGGRKGGEKGREKEKARME